jgi:mRNA interferase MazF
MRRGDVYRVALPPSRGRVQHGPRFAVVLQADEFLPLSTTIVAPTSRSAPARTFRPVIGLEGAQTRVLVEQLRVVDATTLKEKIGELDRSEQDAVDEALALVLGLS